MPDETELSTTPTAVDTRGGTVARATGRAEAAPFPPLTPRRDNFGTTAASRSAHPAPWERIAAWLLTGLGLAAVALAVAADYVTVFSPAAAAGENTGFGPSQIALAVTGLAGFFAGLDFRTGFVLRGVRLWQRADGALLANVARFAAAVAQVGLLVLVIRLFRLESPALFERVVVLAFYGFIASHLLPRASRLPFFVALSLLGLYAVFGAADAAWMAGTGLALIGICHLPIAYWWRVALLVGTGGMLAAMRAGWAASPWSMSVWPILASMFMFRLVVYMYDLRHMKERPGIAQSIAYFFLLPNLAFPLFPVVDFATFRRTYFDRDEYAIYREGIAWMFRGVAHLLLYRAVYAYIVIPPADVASTWDLGRYMGANFLLYLRVSGTFHLIVGILHLFGFRLPETHRFFYLASSFTDLWRRINVYWKDFMMKVVYYPVYFPLKRRWKGTLGDTFALVVATLAVFVVTWSAHAYQWFWILGTFLMSWTDVAFWSVLAVLLVGNTLWEMKRGRMRTLGQPALPVRALVARAVRTAGTFLVICTLWSLWTSETFGAWFAMWRSAGVTLGGLLALVGVVLAGALVFTALFNRRANATGAEATRSVSDRAWTLRGTLVPAAALAVLVIAEPGVASRFPLEAQDVIYKIRTGELNKRDAALLQQGYYENLTGVNRFSSQVWELQSQRPKDWRIISESGATRRTTDFLRIELLPSVEIMYRGAPFRTNRWGMRDDDYAKVPPPGTVRVALLGPSYAMGDGVRNEDTFEALVEQRLNREVAPRTGERYEILNFAVSRYRPTQHLRLLETKVLDFEPDVVLVMAHAVNDFDIVTHVGHAVAEGVEIPYDFVRAIVREAGIEGTTDKNLAVARLRPFRNELLARTYQRIAEVSRERGARPVWVYLEMPEPGPDPAERESFIRFGRDAGFTVLNLSDVYEGHSLEALQVAPFDRHPNAKGHQVIADALFDALRADPSLLKPGTGNGRTESRR
ncbi:MAG: hypothetical protein M3373_06925 [Gemmatimonadota bacterium]|nr:hypothetical protein [Gemmatimonadota bacterium]